MPKNQRYRFTNRKFWLKLPECKYVVAALPDLPKTDWQQKRKTECLDKVVQRAGLAKGYNTGVIALLFFSAN